MTLPRRLWLVSSKNKWCLRNGSWSALESAFAVEGWKCRPTTPGKPWFRSEPEFWTIRWELLLDCGANMKDVTSLCYLVRLGHCRSCLKRPVCLGEACLLLALVWPP